MKTIEDLTITKNLLTTLGRLKVVDASPLLLDVLFRLLIIDKTRLEQEELVLRYRGNKNGEV